ncbi:MAG: ABC transporter ATP-binding protein [Atribacterota bacterium]|nr:ABC transporter ATP-binding protein [Atribacterota bacterium]MDD4895841.1 ABC transporter ATP-binding protein [Atribacterota bacterium]MDD5636708.1 ABC transporter ATP-binding protein [Atribacterota bacterium]
MKNDFLELKELVKIFGGSRDAVTAVDRVNLKVKEGELVTLLGPSGCGKTTILRMISGFELPTSGKIYIDREEVTLTPPNKRPTAMVFQNYALFPHMTVAQNIVYGLKIHGESHHAAMEKAERVMKLVGLEKLGNRSPAQLSGGQQQRVSLARSLIMEPKVLLLDEPLSNLDAKLRVTMRLEIRKLQQRVGITSIYVTHDQLEAMSLSDRVVILKDGRIQQIGTPQEIYARPNNRFVADFIGKANFLNTFIEKVVSDKEVVINLLDQKIVIPEVNKTFNKDDRTLLVLRPESIGLEKKKPDTIVGTIHEIVYLGNQVTYLVDIAGQLVTVEVSNPQECELFQKGEEVSIKLPQKSLHLLPWEED